MVKRKIASEFKDKHKLYECIVKVPDNLKTHIIKHLDDKGIDDICECLYNVIFTDMNLSKKKKTLLKKHIRNFPNIKKITNANISVSKRRAALSQSGSGIGLILSTVLPLLTSLFSRK
jgi:L-lactate utilization protein LutC